MLEVDTGATKFLRALSAGEGFASQNSKTSVVGIGTASETKSVTVTFPSGRKVSTGEVSAGELLTVDEASGTVTRSRYRPAPVSAVN